MAWLHDVLEDTSVTSHDLRSEGIPPRVIHAVEALTHAPGEPNVDYWARVKANPVARAVKLADIKDNTDPFRAPKDPETRRRLWDKYGQALDFLLS